jgi:hypothetical protein
MLKLSPRHSYMQMVVCKCYNKKVKFSMDSRSKVTSIYGTSQLLQAAIESLCLWKEYIF